MDDADAGNDGGRDGNREGDRTGTSVGGREGDGDGVTVTADYYETDAERVLAFEVGDRTAAVIQNRDGYAMLAVRTSATGDELERYYGFEMALDHAAERLGVRPDRLPIPEDAADMGI